MLDNSDSQHWHGLAEHWHGLAKKTRALAIKHLDLSAG
jgi:hypothetical protein